MTLQSDIVTELNNLNAAKQAIKAALIAKGVTVSDSDTLLSYATKIGEMTMGAERHTFTGGYYRLSDDGWCELVYNGDYAGGWEYWKTDSLTMSLCHTTTMYTYYYRKYINLPITFTEDNVTVLCQNYNIPSTGGSGGIYSVSASINPDNLGQIVCTSSNVDYNQAVPSGTFKIIVIGDTVQS